MKKKLIAAICLVGILASSMATFVFAANSFAPIGETPVVAEKADATKEIVAEKIGAIAADKTLTKYEQRAQIAQVLQTAPEPKATDAVNARLESRAELPTERLVKGTTPIARYEYVSADTCLAANVIFTGTNGIDGVYIDFDMSASDTADLPANAAYVCHSTIAISAGDEELIVLTDDSATMTNGIYGHAYDLSSYANLSKVTVNAWLETANGARYYTFYKTLTEDQILSTTYSLTQG